MKHNSSFLTRAVLASTLFCLFIPSAQAVLVPIPAGTVSDSTTLPDGGNGYNFAGNASVFTITNGYTVGQTGPISIDNNNGVAGSPFLVSLNFAGNAIVQGDIGSTNPLPSILLNTNGIANNIFNFQGTTLNAGEVVIANNGGTTIFFSSMVGGNRNFNTDFLSTNANVDQIRIDGDAIINNFTGRVGSFSDPFALIDVASTAVTQVNFADDVVANKLQFSSDDIVTFLAHPFLGSIVTLAGDNTGTVSFLGPNTIINFPIGAANAYLAQVNIGTTGPANTIGLSSNIFAQDVVVQPGTELFIGGTPTITTPGGLLLLTPTATLDIPHSTTLNVTGDLTFGVGSHYDVDMNGNLQDTGLINVSGVTSTNNVPITLLEPGYSPGVETVIPLLNSLGGITGLPTIANPNSLLTKFSTSLTSGNTILNLVIESIPATDLALQTNTQGIAGAIDEIALAGPTGSPLDQVIAQMSQFTNVQSLNDSLATLAPIVDGAILYESFNRQNTVFGVVGDRMDRMNFWRIHTASPSATGVSSGDLKKSDQGAWLKFYRQHGSQQFRHGIAGYKDDMWGVVLGGDTMITPWTLIGASVAWSALDVNNDVSASKTHANSYEGSMYASLDFDCPLYVNATVGLAYNNYIINRNIVFNNLSLYPRAHFHGFQTGAKVETGYVFGTYRWHIIPIASVFYSNLNLRGYKETKAGAAGLLVEGQDFDTLLSGLGIKFVDDYAMNSYMLLQSEIHAMGFYDFINDGMQTTSQFIGAGPSFTTNGFSPERGSMNLGASVILFTHYSFNLSADYDYYFKEDYHSHSGFFKIRYEFS